MLLSAAATRHDPALLIFGTMCMVLGILRVLSLLTPQGREVGFGNVPLAFLLGVALSVVGYLLIRN